MISLPFVSHQHRLIAIWSPKSACTTVVAWFVRVEGVNKQIDWTNMRFWLLQNGYTCSYEEAGKLMKQGYRSVQFVRNPYSRAPSAYISKFCFRNSAPIDKMEDLEPFALEFMQGYNQWRGLPENEFQGLSFTDYLEHLSWLLKRHKKIDHHWTQQAEKNPFKRFKADYLVKVESLNEDLIKVNDIFGFEHIEQGKANRTMIPEGFERTDEDLSRMNCLEINQNRFNAQKKNMLTPETRKLIGKIYADDFKCFDYKRVR